MMSSTTPTPALDPTTAGNKLLLDLVQHYSTLSTHFEHVIAEMKSQTNQVEGSQQQQRITLLEQQLSNANKTITELNATNASLLGEIATLQNTNANVSAPLTNAVPLANAALPASQSQIPTLLEEIVESVAHSAPEEKAEKKSSAPKINAEKNYSLAVGKYYSIKTTSKNCIAEYKLALTETLKACESFQISNKKSRSKKLHLLTIKKYEDMGDFLHDIALKKIDAEAQSHHEQALYFYLAGLTELNRNSYQHDEDSNYAANKLNFHFSILNVKSCMREQTKLEINNYLNLHKIENVIKTITNTIQRQRYSKLLNKYQNTLEVNEPEPIINSSDAHPPASKRPRFNQPSPSQSEGETENKSESDSESESEKTTLTPKNPALLKFVTTKPTVTTRRQFFYSTYSSSSNHTSNLLPPSNSTSTTPISNVATPASSPTSAALHRHASSPFLLLPNRTQLNTQPTAVTNRSNCLSPIEMLLSQADREEKQQGLLLSR